MCCCCCCWVQKNNRISENMFFPNFLYLARCCCVVYETAVRQYAEEKNANAASTHRNMVLASAGWPIFHPIFSLPRKFSKRRDKKSNFIFFSLTKKQRTIECVGVQNWKKKKKKIIQFWFIDEQFWLCLAVERRHIAVLHSTLPHETPLALTMSVTFSYHSGVATLWHDCHEGV